MNRRLSTPAYCRREAYAEFGAQVPHVETTWGLFRAAFAIARHERPTADVRQAEKVVAELAGVVRRRVRSSDTEARLAHLHEVLFELVGLRGNAEDYYDPANSYLPDVLRTRRGLPITLVLVYKCVAEGVGLTVHGINAPGHFLAAVEASAVGRPNATNPSWMVVDPFFGGALLNEQDICRRVVETTGREMVPSSRWHTPATGRQWITRMLANLQAVFASTGRERDLFAMQELQALVDQSAPNRSDRVQ